MSREMREGERIIDLVNVVEEGEERIVDLIDVIEEGDKRAPAKVAVVNANLQEEIMKKVEETAERVAREMFPAIAERLIREEIEKLKQK